MHKHNGEPGGISRHEWRGSFPEKTASLCQADISSHRGDLWYFVQQSSPVPRARLHDVHVESPHIMSAPIDSRHPPCNVCKVQHVHVSMTHGRLDLGRTARDGIRALNVNQTLPLAAQPVSIRNSQSSLAPHQMFQLSTPCLEQRQPPKRSWFALRCLRQKDKGRSLLLHPPPQA